MGFLPFAGCNKKDGLTDTSPPTLDLLEDKFSITEAQRVVVRVDGSGEIIPFKK